MWRSAAKDNLRPRDKSISGLNHTPHAAAVYASWPLLPPAHATLASRRLATPYLDWTCTSRSRQLSWRLPFAHPTSCTPFARRIVIRVGRLLRWPQRLGYVAQVHPDASPG